MNSQTESHSNKRVCSMLKYPDSDLPEEGIGALLDITLVLEDVKNGRCGSCESCRIVVTFGSLKMYREFPNLGQAYDCFISIASKYHVGYSFLSNLQFRKNIL